MPDVGSRRKWAISGQRARPSSPPARRSDVPRRVRSSRGPRDRRPNCSGVRLHSRDPQEGSMLENRNASAPRTSRRFAASIGTDPLSVAVRLGARPQPRRPLPRRTRAGRSWVTRSDMDTSRHLARPSTCSSCARIGLVTLADSASALCRAGDGADRDHAADRDRQAVPRAGRRTRPATSGWTRSATTEGAGAPALAAPQ